MDPKVVILDEPTTGMDISQSKEIMGLFKELNRSGTTFIVITHNMKVVAEYARRVVVMLNGEILLDGPSEEVFYRPDILREAFIIAPQVVQLAQALKHHNFPQNVLTVNQMFAAFNELIGDSAI